MSEQEGPAAGSVDPERWRDLNRAWWDERTPLHVASPLYDVAAFRAGASRLRPFEVDLAGDVAGQRLVHLQCHFGLDSMSWARHHGASVVGLDFSRPAVDAATELAHDLGLDATFVCADVYDAPEALGGERFDVVYTGLGALNWLPDLERWADVVARVLRPSGRLILAEFHPFSWVFEARTTDPELRVSEDYFAEEAFVDDGHPGSYADLDAPTRNNATVEYQHTLGAVLSVLLRRRFDLSAFREFDHTLFPQFPALEQQPDGTYRFPAGRPRIPLMYALAAQAPA